MSARPDRTTRPSALRSLGNPAEAAPDDAPAAGPAKDPAPAVAAVPDPPAEQAADAEAPASAETPAKPRARTRRAATPKGSGKDAATAQGAPKRAASKKGTAADTEAVKAEVAETAGRADNGRPRVPREGPTTRHSLDLAVSETRELERIAGVIGRATGKAQGRARIRPSHLARVAVRRLITDSEFRKLVTDDIAHDREALNRPE